MEIAAVKKNKFEVKDPISALTHFIGFLAVIPVFIRLLDHSDSLIKSIALTVFSVSLILLYSASTIYHTLKLSNEKTAFLRQTPLVADIA